MTRCSRPLFPASPWEKHSLSLELRNFEFYYCADPSRLSGRGRPGGHLRVVEERDQRNAAEDVSEQCRPHEIAEIFAPIPLSQTHERKPMNRAAHHVSERA